MIQTVPSPIGAVTLRSPDGLVVVSVSSVSAVESLLMISLAVPIQHLALLGQHEPARVAVEERDLQLLLQGRDLPAHRRLAHAQRLTGMGEAAGLGGGMEDAELVPVH